MIQLNLYDPGMAAITAHHETLAAAVEALQKGAYPNYTDALLSQGGRITHIASRQVGETQWTVKERRHKP